jgi:hypothetical protein
MTTEGGESRTPHKHLPGVDVREKLGSRKHSDLVTHLEAGGDEAGKGELVNVRRQGQAGPGGNLRGHGLLDASS